MEIYRVSFIGHRRVENIQLLEERLEPLIRQLIRGHEYVEFYVGRNGEFDIYVVPPVIKRVQQALGKENSSLMLVLPYHVKDEEYYEAYYDDVMIPVSDKVHYKNGITQRNRWMADNSDLLIAYVEQPSGGAYQMLQYAKRKRIKTINIAHGYYDITL